MAFGNRSKRKFGAFVSEALPILSMQDPRCQGGRLSAAGPAWCTQDELTLP